MAEVKIEQSPLAGVITSIPELLMQATQLKTQSDIANQELQIKRSQQELSQEQKATELSVYKKQLGMDAAGYGNIEVTDYFQNLMLSKGTINVDGGNLTWTGQDVFPTQDEAWSKYKSMVTKGNKTISESDYRVFNQYWGEVTGVRNRRMTAELQKLNMQGYSQDDIEAMMADNPTFVSSMSNLMDHADPETQKFYAGFMPKKNVDFFDRIAESPLATVGVGVGTAVAGEAGYRFATGTPAEILEEAKLNYKTMTSGSRGEVKAAQEMLDEAIKSKDAKQIKSAKDLLKETKESVKTTRVKGSKELRKMMDENKRWKQLGKGKWGSLKHLSSLRGFAPTLLGLGGGTVGGFIGGETGAAVGKGVGGTTGLAVGAMPLGKYVAKRLAMKAPAMAARFGIAAMADSPVVPIGDIIGAVMAAGMGTAEVFSAINDWKKANR